MKTGPVLILVPLALMAAGCARPPVTVAPAPVIAVENFLADFTRQVPGTSGGALPHSSRRRPARVRADAAGHRGRGGRALLIVNGAGLESFLSKLLANAGGDRPVVEASAGSTAAPRGKGRSWRAEASPRGRARSRTRTSGWTRCMAVTLRGEHPGRASAGSTRRVRRLPRERGRVHRGSCASWTRGSPARSRPSRRRSACWSPTTRASAISPTATGFGSSAPSFRA